MTTKKMTHAGMVSTQGKEPFEMWLRETPKFWTDGELWWAKFNAQGKPNTVAWAQERHSYIWYILDLTTIRPLTPTDTPTDLRVFLQQTVDHQRDYVSRLEDELKSLRIRLVSAINERDRAKKKLATFDKKYLEVAKAGDS